MSALNAQIERYYFNRNVEQIGDKWYWIGEANSLPGSPFILPDEREAHAVRAFDTDWMLVPILENEIERRSFNLAYIRQLTHIVGRYGDAQIETQWKLLRATPEQRCSAAIATWGVCT